MAEKIFNTRVVNKHDLEANWNKAVNFIPLKGELIVYDVDDTHSYERFKIGDGVQNVNDLPFYNDGFVSYNEQNLTDEQKAQARANIDAIANSDIPIKTVELTEIPNKFRVWEYDTGIYYIIPSSTVFAITVKTGTGDDTKEGGIMISGITKLPIFVNKYSNDSVDRWIYWYPSRSGFTSQQLEYSKTDLTWTVNTVEKLPALSGSPDIAGQTIRVNNDGKGYVLSNNVWSVNGQTDDVTITAEDIGAATQEYVSTLVGDTSVAEQIDAAIAEIPQADWNQNDESASDYIKNRTHYEEENIIDIAGLEYVLGDTFSTTVDTYEYDTIPLEVGQKWLWQYQTQAGSWISIYSDAVEVTILDDGSVGMTDGAFIFKENKMTLPTSFMSATNLSAFKIVGVSGAITGEPIVHHLDPKYIKDMYYDNTIYTLTTINDVRGLVNNDPSISGSNELVEGLTFRVVVDGVIYDNVPVYGNVYYAGGDTIGIGDLYSGNQWITTDYGFMYTHYGWVHNPDVFTNGIQAVEIYTVDRKLKQIDPKYIKDMYYEVPEVWTSLDVIDKGDEHFYLDYTLELDKPYTVRIDGIKYSFDSLKRGEYHSASGYYLWYLGSKIGNAGISVHTWEYPFAIWSAGYTGPKTETRVRFEDGSYNHTVEFLESEGEIHHIDPKYIKDMYHEEPVELFSVENAEFEGNQYMCEPPFAIEDGNTYIVNWDGVEYTCEAYTLPGFPTGIGNTSDYGGKGKGEPFFIGYDHLGNVTFIEALDGLTTHTVSVAKVVCHTIDPKYIKDMYYDKGVTITEVVPETTVDGFEVMEDPIYGIQNAISMTPVVGATYIVNWDGAEYTTTCNSFIDTPFMYIGNENYVNMQPEGDIPFAIVFVDGNVFLVTESASSHTISVTEYNHDLKQIDTKYLPILEKVEETIIKANVTDIIELRGPEYGKLLGKYVVVIDGVSETVEFIDDGIGSFVETDSFAIESWTDPEGNVDNNGFTMEFANQDGNSHSVEIIAIKDVIKEEYLPDVGYATEEYVDECVAAVREEIDFIQVNYISDLPNVIGSYSMMLVTSDTSLDDVQWNGTLLIMRRFMAYGIWNFTAIDSVGAFYNGSVNLRNNTVSLYFVDSLANKADKKSIDKDYIALTDIENGYEYIIHMKNGNLISVCKIVSIEVTTMPTQTEYIDGEPFNPAGIVITATCQDGTTRIIDSNTIIYNSVVTLDNCSAFEIQYVDAGIKYTTTIVLTCINAGSSLSDFKYTIEEEGTYTLTGWKDTKNGVFSTECIIPDSNKINL